MIHKKNVCFVMYDFSILGGAEQVGVNLANALCSEYNVFIYSICGNGEDIPYKVQNKISVEYGKCKKERIRRLIGMNFQKFKQYVQQNNIDVVIAIGGYASTIISFTRFFTRAKYVFCDHGALRNQWKEKDITCMRWLCAKIYHKIVVLTDITKKDYSERFHIPEKKVVRIYNWISPELAVGEHKYDTESKKILSVGRFGSEKGQDLLVCVAEQVLPKYPEWSWEVFGDGENFDSIKKSVLEKKLDRKLILKGNVKNVSELYDQYSMFVLTSYREGLPLVLLEAKICKLPMISFDVDTGPREIIDQENGILIPPYDCEKMAEVIEKLIKDKEYRLSLSKGTDCNIDKFDYENILKQWRDLIGTL